MPPSLNENPRSAPGLISTEMKLNWHLRKLDGKKVVEIKGIGQLWLKLMEKVMKMW